MGERCDGSAGVFPDAEVAAGKIRHRERMESGNAVRLAGRCMVPKGGDRVRIKIKTYESGRWARRREGITPQGSRR
jgi:hypothetical protein